jgi:Domain of unknown function (DUF5666)
MSNENKKEPHMIALPPVVVAFAVATLTACSGASSGDRPATDSATSTSSSSASAGPARQGGPAASGRIAAISGSTMQVQNPQTGQVAVTWSRATKFTHMVDTTLAAVRAGDCVTATAPSGTSASATSFTATTLVIGAQADGTCGAAVGPGDGQPPTGAPSAPPSGPPPSAPAAVASGTVGSVSGSTLVIAARRVGSNSTRTVTVTVDSNTKITTDATTTSKSVKVGKCVSAQGAADSTGTVAATRIRISDPVNGQCALGPGGGSSGGSAVSLPTALAAAARAPRTGYRRRARRRGGRRGKRGRCGRHR